MMEGVVIDMINYKNDRSLVSYNNSFEIFTLSLNGEVLILEKEFKTFIANISIIINDYEFIINNY